MKLRVWTEIGLAKFACRDKTTDLVLNKLKTNLAHNVACFEPLQNDLHIFEYSECILILGSDHNELWPFAFDELLESLEIFDFSALVSIQELTAGHVARLERLVSHSTAQPDVRQLAERNELVEHTVA